jgi:hypothetical protein
MDFYIYYKGTARKDFLPGFSSLIFYIIYSFYETLKPFYGLRGFIEAIRKRASMIQASRRP